MRFSAPATSANPHVFNISPEAIGAIGAIINFVVTIIVSKMTSPPSDEVVEMVENIRYPAASARQSADAAGAA
jgi:cation/acetate symporter